MEIVPTERLSILVAAAALRQFTIPELVAHTGANASTVDQVIRREAGRGRFSICQFKPADSDLSGPEEERIDRSQPRPSRAGRPPNLWQANDPPAILAEVAEEEAGMASLRSRLPLFGQGSGGAVEIANVSSLDMAEALIASGEDALDQAFEAEDMEPGLRRRLALTSLNFLRAGQADLERPFEGQSALDSPPYADKRQELHLKARSAEAVANLMQRHATALPIDREQLRVVAQSLADARDALRPDEFANRYLQMVGVSLDAGLLPPMMVVTDVEQSPSDLFPFDLQSEWLSTELSIPDQPIHFLVWSENWAEPLLMKDLASCLIVSHEDTPASNLVLDYLLSRVDTTTRARTPPPATVVVSTVRDFDVAARVQASGASFYPMHTNVEAGLIATMKHCIVRSMERTIDMTGATLSFFGTPAGYRC